MILELRLSHSVHFPVGTPEELKRLPLSVHATLGLLDGVDGVHGVPDPNGVFGKPFAPILLADEERGMRPVLSGVANAEPALVRGAGVAARVLSCSGHALAVDWRGVGGGVLPVGVTSFVMLSMASKGALYLALLLSFVVVRTLGSGYFFWGAAAEDRWGSFTPVRVLANAVCARSKDEEQKRVKKRRRGRNTESFPWAKEGKERSSLLTKEFVLVRRTGSVVRRSES